MGTDLTTGAEEAVRQGAALARDLNAALMVCHIIPEFVRVGMLFPQSRIPPRSFVAELSGRAQDAVRRELAAVLGDAAESVEIVIDSGTPHVGLLAQADATGARVIVIGPGGTGIDVVRHAAVPVLVARKSPPGAVIGATDFSDSSREALTVAAAEAVRRGVPLHLVHVLDVGAYALGGGQPDTLPYLQGSSAIALDGIDDLQADAEQRLRRTLEEFAVAGHTAVVPGHAAAAIVAYGESIQAGLIVVGTHGRSGFARLTLGSTAADIVDSAPCSVLVSRSATTSGRG